LRILAKIVFLMIFLGTMVRPALCNETPYESSGGRKTPSYDQTLAWFGELADSCEYIQMTSFGLSSQGRDLPLVIADAQKRFDPNQHRDRQDKVVLLVQACIHAGESCGKDAGMLLFRDLATDETLAAELLENVTFLFIPVFNVDGHERFGPFNRINQNGPDEMGWRVTAQNLNLNRDFLKADTPEMRAWLELYQQWLPDFLVDVHSTDGADYQYTITYGLETQGNMEAGLSDWTIEFREAVNEAMAGAGYPMAPYVSFRDWHDPRSGLEHWVAGPRYSQGYAAIQNRPGLLIETHMLKDYPTRVDSAHRLILETLRHLNNEASELRARVLAADEFTASPVFRREPFTLSLKATDNPRPFEFLGVSYEKVKSEITGGDWFQFSDQPETMTINMYDEMEPDQVALLPEAYIVPPEWTQVIDRLDWHGVQYGRLTEPVELEVGTWRFREASWQEKPYEGHHPVSFELEPLVETRVLPRGSVVVDMNQRAARVVAHLLEPRGRDSLVRWGYLDSIFERVEYVESYVIEEMIQDMVSKKPELLRELDKKKQQDPDFAANPWEIREWFYEKTPFYDSTVGVYPVFAINERILLKSLPVKIY
jgi:Zinc carboxypeptidase